MSASIQLRPSRAGEAAALSALALRCGARVIGIDADPGAEPFYAHHGAVTVGRVPSGSIPGRALPRMEIAL